MSCLRLYVTILVGIWLYVATVPAVGYAHAYVEQSTPYANAVLSESPELIQIRFTEAVESKLSKIELFDAEGLEIKGKLFAHDEQELRYAIPRLPRGIYEVKWQVLSVDTHVTEGSFRFSILMELEPERPAETISLDGIQEESAAAEQSMSDDPINGDPPLVNDDRPQSNELDMSQADQMNSPSSIDAEEIQTPPPTIQDEEVMVNVPSPPSEQQQPQSQSEPQQHHHHHHDQVVQQESVLPTIILTLLRIIELFTAVVATGYLFNKLYLWSGTIQLAPTFLSKMVERRLWLTMFVIFTLTGVARLVLLFSQLPGSVVGLFGMISSFLVDDLIIGFATWIRPIIILYLWMLTLAPRQDERWSKLFQGCALFPLLASFAWTGHAMSSQQSVMQNMLMHMLHMTSVAIWCGGLVGIAAVSFRSMMNRHEWVELNQIIRRFSNWALWLIIFVTTSGVLLTWQRINDFEQLYATMYGQMVLWKMLILLGVIGMGWFHRKIFIPRLTQQWEEESSVLHAMVYRRFQWGIRVEIVLATVALLLAGLLSTTAPPT
jgi:putative copper export protein/methionine-rich copper-binding protein CopC